MSSTFPALEDFLWAVCSKNVATITLITITMVSSLNEDWHGYLDFGLEQDTSVEIDYAKLRLYFTAVENPQFDFLNVRCIGASWNEATLTWNNRPTSYYTFFLCQECVTSTGWYEFDVTDAVRVMAAGSITDYGFFLYNDEGINLGHDGYWIFRSTEYSTATYRPELKMRLRAK